MRPGIAGQVHLFQVLGEGLALDVSSGSLHWVDEAARVAIAGYGLGREAALEGTGRALDPAELAEAWGEVEGLVHSGLLFGPEPPHPAVDDSRPLKALCLNIAHDCDLACTYCFAGRGAFGGPRGLMSPQIARAAIAFLATSSGPVSSLEVDFFGGEPLLNLEVIHDTVACARTFVASTGKSFRFTITTNGTRLTPDVINILCDQDFGVVLSLDGREAVHDRHRRDRAGAGSYHRVAGPMREVARRRPPHTCYVRGTYTRDNLDFSRDVKHLVEMGFPSVSLEPVVASTGEGHALRWEDLVVIEEEYERLAAMYVQEAKAGRGFRFFHFELDVEAGPCLPKRVMGCGAGVDYLAVSPDGGLYPCHQLLGDPGFLLGHVERGIQRPDLVARFARCTALTKPACRDCWARYHCGGGCHASAYLVNRDIQRPYELGCALQKKRLECALYVQAKLRA